MYRIDENIVWQNRATFYNVCAKIMHFVLSDHARRKQTEKRGSAYKECEFEALIDKQQTIPDIIALSTALER